MDQNIELWKIKKLIKSLESMKGNGTSMISLIIPSKGQISLTNRMLTEEYGTATNIKSRVNRLSVLSAITSAQQRLKLYKQTPPNGLVIYSGTITTDEGKEKKVNFDIEPFKPITRSLYKCDNKFHVKYLLDLLVVDEKYAFIIMDGNGCLYSILSGNNKEILQQFSVDLPKKHGRGGQSALRFARLRLEARHNYLKKVCELANNLYLKENKATIQGVFLAGSAELKNQMLECDAFSPVLKAIVIKSIDISYGGLNGLNQAIELASTDLKNVDLMKEKKILANFYEQISKDTGLYFFGINDTIYALEMGAIEKLIVYEDLELVRQELKNTKEGTTSVVFVDPKKDNSKIYINEGVNLDIINEMELVEWFSINYKNFGAELILVSDKSQEGTQFVRGFGGLGGILRWEVDFDINNNNELYDDDYNEDDEDFFI